MLPAQYIDGNTPLLLAIGNSNIELSMLLIEKGADVHAEE